MERLHIPITGDSSNFRSALQSARDGVRQTAKQIEDSGMTIEQVFNRISNAAAMSLAGFSVKEFVQKMVQVRGEFQQLEVAFNTMLGSAEKANALMQQITKTAATTPFDLQGVANGAKQLIAYGVAAEEVNDKLIHLGDIAAGLSLPLNDLVYLYGTTMVQGRMFTQDLRQFQNRGIPIAEELAKVLGVTKDKVGELVTAGKVGAKEFNQAIMAMSSEGGKFAGLMEAQSKTITGQISNIEDAIDTMFNEIGQQSEGIISGTLDIITSLVENWESVGAAILAAAEAYGIYKATLMAMTAYNNSITNISYDAEIASLSKLLPMKEAEADADLQIAVAEGRLSASKAEAIASMRMEAQEQLKTLAVKETAAKAEYKSALEKHLMAQRNMAVAQSQVKIAMESGTAEEVVAAKRGAATAKLELQNAAIAKNTAQKNLNTISTQKNALANGLDAAASAGNTAATGVLAAAKMGLKRAIDAVNASFLASPLFWIAAVIAGVTFAVYKLVTAETAEAAARRKSNEQIDEFNKKLDEQEAKIKEHIATIKSETATEYQKVKAYEQLKHLMPSLTDEYSRAEIAALDMVDAEQKINEAMDDAEFEDAKDKVEGYREAVERVKKSMEDDARYNGGKNAIFNLGQLERAEADLAEAEKRLRKIQELIAKAAEEMREEAKPIEIRVREANENYQTKKEILAFYDEAMVLAHRVESANDKIDYEAARSDFDAFISKVEADIKELEEQIEKEPWNPKLEIEKKEKERMYNEMVAMKDSWRGIFASPITVWFQTKYTSAKEAEEKARGDRKGMRFDGPTGKYVPLEEEISRTPKEWLKLKKKAWDDAQKNLDDYLKGPGKSSDAKNNKEIERLKEAVSKAKKAYEEAGGSTGKSKAAEQARKQYDQQAKTLQQRQKFEDDLEKLTREAADARSQAEIAAIRNGAERERAERQAAHNKALKDIQQQENEIYRTIYDQRKAIYETENAGKRYENTALGADGWKGVQKQAEPALQAIREMQKALGDIDPSRLEEVDGIIRNLDLSAFSDDEQKQIRATLDKMLSDTATANADYRRKEEQTYRQLVSQYQIYTDQRLAIEREYSEAVAQIEAALADLRVKQQSAATDEERAAIQEQIDAMTRSLGEASKQQMKSLSDVAMSELQDSPLFSLAWKDLQSVSTETLNMLIGKFRELEGQFAADPKAMKEWSERVKAMSDEVVSRNPFKAMAQARLELEDAAKRKEAAKAVIEEMQAIISLTETRIDMKKAAGFDTSEDEKRLAEARTKLQKATDDLGLAETAEAEAVSKQKKSWEETRREVDELASAISALGEQLGGEAGQIIGLIGNVMTFATTTMDGIKAVSATGAQALSTLEKASVILTIISAAIQLLQTISKLNKDAHAQYEEYAAKVSEVEQLRQAMYEYRMELIKTKQEEQGWFSTTGFQELRDQWVQSAEAMAEYAETAAAAQAVYENESGGGWLTGALSWLGKAVAYIVSIPGKVVTGILDKLGIVDKNSFLGKAIEWTTDVGFGGAEAFIGKLTGELLNAQNYAEGTVAAIKNLRVETRASSSGFLGTGIGGHSQKTQDLQSFVKEKMGVDLFDANGVLTSVELGKRVMEEYGDKMVGETKKTMERLIELKEQYDEWQNQLREFISELYSPLADDMVDALWEWYENGTNVLDAFKSYSADTFRSIGKEMVKQLVNTLLFDQLKENMQALLTGYSLDAAAGQKSEEQLTQELMAGTQLQTENLLNQAKVVAPVLQNAVQTWEEGMERMGLSTEESFENVFSSIKDNFKSMLLDMESDATDFGKQLKKAMYEALLERFVMKAPVTVTIDGEQQTFDSLNSYLDNWQKRANEVAQTMSATEHDTQKSSLEEQIAALEAERKANLEARQQARNRGGLQSQYDSLYNQYGYLLRGGTAKTEEEIKAKERLLAMQEELAKRSAEYDERNTEILAKIRDLRSQLAEIEASETLTDEERAAKIAELNAELEEQLAISKQIAKTYADMAGWTMEMKIDASPLASLGDELLSVLQDTSKGVDDWKKELVEAMTNDLIKEVVYNADFEKSIRDLQEQYVNIMSSDMSAEEKAAAIQKIADAIAALYNTADEKVDGLKNIIPDIDTSPFDNLRDTILDTFTDIEADAKDFRKSLEKTLVKDLLEKMVLDVPLTVTIDGEDKTFDGGFDEYGKDWNKRYIAAVKALQEARKTGNAEAIAEAQAAVDALFDEVEGVYTQLEEGADEFMKRLKEIANDTTFTDMADSLVSSLMDVEGDIADIADDMKKTIVQKLIEAFMVSGQIKPLLEDLQETFNAVMGMDGLTPEQRAQMMRTGFAGTDAEGNAKTFIGIDDESVTQRLSSWQATVRAIMEGIGYSVEGAAGLFDNLGDTILDSLMNTEGGVKDFMQNISETIARELMESYMATEEFQEGLKTVKDDLEAAVKALAEAKTPEEIAAAEEQLKNAKKAAEDFYNEAVGGTKRFTDALKKIENDTTFKDMTGNWVSNLMDFNATAEDWAEEIGQTMAQKIIEQMIVPTMIQPLLDNIQKAFNDAMATNTTSDAEGNAVYNWKGVLNDEGLKASITALQDAYPELKDVVQQILSLSGVKPDFSNSLDSLGDTLLDRLLSLDDDVEDIGKQIGQTLIREMLEQMLSTGQYADRIAAIKKMWQAILTGEDTEHTIEDVLKDIEQLENDITNPENSDFSGLIAKYKSLADVAKEGFSDLRGAFLSSLIDMNGDAETFGKSIGRTMLEQMLDAYVKRTYKEQIAAINKEWAEALQSGNTDALERIKQKVQELYSTISTDVEVSNIADAIKELDKQLDTTFSDMADSWTSTLMDMEATAEDWAQSVGKIIAEKIIKSMVIPAIIQPILDTMQKAWNAAAEQEGATYQTMLDAMMPYLSDLVGAYEELRPIADYILNSLGVYKETVEELKEEVEYALQDMKDNFVSDLMDMEATAEKRAESISRIIAENFIKNFVLGDAFDAQMEQWQQHYESIIHSGLSEDERARQLKLLRDAIASAKEGYVEQALAIQELLGLNAASSDQTATTNMADKITYEQADQLLGVNMAQEMTLEQILATLRGSALTASGSAYLPTGIGTTPAASETAQQIEASLRNLNSLSQPDSDTVREIRGLILIGNTYLYDIKESNAQILRQFGERLDTICSRLATF